jgi:hypothetical protein
MEVERQTGCTSPHQQHLQLQQFFFLPSKKQFYFSLKNDMVFLPISRIWILYIEDLCDIFCKNKWLFSITEKSKIDISHTILIDLHSIWESDPLAME